MECIYKTHEHYTSEQQVVCPACEAGVPLEPIVIYSLDDYKLEDEDGDYIGWGTGMAKEELWNVIKSRIKADCLLVDAHHINWRGSSGYKVINLTDSDELFNKLIPDYDCTFTIYSEGDKTYAVVSSHDVPTGGTWNLYGVVDVEDKLDDLKYHIGDGSLGFNKQYLFNRIKDIFGIDIGEWESKDVTEEYLNVQPVERVLSIKDDTFTLWLDENDNICAVIDYDEEEFANQYYKSIRG